MAMAMATSAELFKLTMDKAASTIPVTSYPEESGWTTYLEGFSGDSDQGSFCSTPDGSSMISDAASAAASKFLENSRFPRDSGFEANIPRKVNVKKPRAKEMLQDDSLEDTASSPVNSPKVGISHDKVHRKTDDHSTSHTVKGITHFLHICRKKTRVAVRKKVVSTAKD